MKRIPWMTELPNRCDHPQEFLVFREGLMGDYVECQKCGAPLPREWVRSREEKTRKEKLQKKLAV